MLYERASVPLYLKWIQYISVINYGFAALVINECNAIGTSSHPPTHPPT